MPHFWETHVTLTVHIYDQIYIGIQYNLYNIYICIATHILYTSSHPKLIPWCLRWLGWGCLENPERLSPNWGYLLSLKSSGYKYQNPSKLHSILVNPNSSWLLRSQGFFPPNSVPTLTGSYGSCKGQCLIRVIQLGRGIFLVIFRIKLFLWNDEMHFDCAGSHKVRVPLLWSSWAAACYHILLVIFRKKWLLWMMTCISTAQAHTKCWSRFCDPTGPQHFTCKFPYKVALLTCWPAFRVRGLAQSVCLLTGLFLFCGILPVNSCIKWLFWNVDVHFDYAGSHKVCVCVLGSFWSAAFYL